MRASRLWRWRVGLAAALLGASLPLPSHTLAAATLTVSAGAQSTGREVQVNAFAPAVTNINVGDTVTWRLDSTEFHTVTFPGGQTPPDFVTPGPDGVFLNQAAVLPAGGNTYDGTTYTNSGLMMHGGPGPEPPTYSLTFPRAGTYQYLCVIHPGMVGQIVVSQAGGPADTQATVDTRRRDEVNSLLASQAVAVLLNNATEQPSPSAGAGLAMGAGAGLVDVQRFLPSTVIIHTGDTLTWINNSPAPHTVTFLAGQTPPAVVIPQPQPTGPPLFELNPEMLLPAGDPTAYDGSSMLNSGFVEPGANGTFSATFTQPGTFPYLCLLHDGMIGSVVVEE